MFIMKIFALWDSVKGFWRFLEAKMQTYMQMPLYVDSPKCRFSIPSKIDQCIQNSQNDLLYSISNVQKCETGVYLHIHIITIF